MLFQGSGSLPFVNIVLTHACTCAPNVHNQRQALEVDVVHDIPITVLRASEIQQYMPPDVPTPQVRLVKDHYQPTIGIGL